MPGDLRKFIPVLVIAIAAAIVYFALQGSHTPQQPADGDAPAPAEARPGKYSRVPAMAIDTSKTYTATFDTSRGTFVCDLYPKEAPITVNNFIFLARDKFYDGTKFHRVIADFMIQGGDPTGTGSGGPGYNFQDEVASGRQFTTGSLAMANAGPGTNGSQFFVTHVPTAWLQGKHTIFGQIREGQDIVNAIRQGDTLKTVTIEEK